jgi:hypothetical protein
LHHALFRGDNHLTFRVVAELHALDHPQQMRRIHTVERRVSGKKNQLGSVYAAQKITSQKRL